MHSQSPRPAPSTARFLRSAEVAAILQVSPKTIARWAQQGLLPCQRTLGGHRRYPEPAIRELAASLVAEVGASGPPPTTPLPRLRLGRCWPVTPAS
jgi:excisionase family DNA binding protein